MAHVVVGMSGGVDSSVAASLLVEAGHTVTGVYMKNWSKDLPGMKCPWAEDLADAKRVAVQLGIDFKVYDFEREYKQRVVDYMIAEYQAGRTPNPDIMCNQEVKFRLFLDAARADGAEMIATGHYAQTNDGRLYQAVDASKDQTYFLYRVREDALRQTLFPLGGYTKQQVRELAKERGLWTATKKESMGVCFVGSVGIRDFIGEYVQAVPGKIIEKETGSELGMHDGAIFYTIGQRHGLAVGGGLPLYVVGKDMQANAVYVSKNLNDESMWKQSIALEQMHWIADAPQDESGLRVRLRHRGALLDCDYKDGTLQLHEQERAVAPGQSAVLYQGDECIGGGIVAG